MAVILGINSRNKVIKHMAYGFNDDAYVYLEKLVPPSPELGDKSKKALCSKAERWSLSMSMVCPRDLSRACTQVPRGETPILE